MTTFADVFDGAKLVKVYDDHLPSKSIAVWHGGHTINFYNVHGEPAGIELEAVETISIGDFETGEVSREEAEEAIEREWSTW